MDARVLMAAVLGSLALAACDPLPRPDYVDVKQPASYRVEPNGTRIDNANYKLDNQGYRIDDQGERIGMVDVPEKTEGDNSNAVAGYYISTTGQMAPGRVASTSDIVPTVSNEPTPSQMPQQVPITPTPGVTPPPAGYGTPGNNPGNK